MQEKPLPLEYDPNSAEELPESVSAALTGCPGTFSAAFIDDATGLKWSVGSKPFRAASLIKLFVMAQAFEEKRAGRLDFDEIMVMTGADIVGGAGIMQAEPVGTARAVKELVGLMITESDNVATNLLIKKIGMAAVNRLAQESGCRDTVLNRLMMDFDAASRGRENYTSVRDVAELLLKIHKRKCVDGSGDDMMCEILGHQTDRCKIPFFLPAGTVCRHKTGELPGAEHDAGIVTCPRGSYILAIMSDGLADAETGRRAVALISRAVYDWYSDRQVLPAAL